MSEYMLIYSSLRKQDINSFLPYSYFCLWEDLDDTVMSGGVKLRVNIQLECTECKRRNYSTSKNKKNTTERLEINKYCKWDKKVTLHKETKK
ncbi:hypothetical protein IX317_001777 [Fusobacterium sp. DD29]|jgi:large subunit ribosomal protein L33|nr:hypothetical protein [Fusobacterium sp. DD45]MBR8711702.1 hypothetical protein [Fusobacterium sp. DD28]MBR8750096.1 hypothetical protein [Fusobacterium sp. DD29]MBR8752263.1 hypothetical protein [Fusobacterium sp. DD26]MBR8762326.1 hypothetical protein [Fusobacterium sp. DD25]MBR8768348.1 hypothetical protein [Fusobacterium sp. DD43]MBR8772419.1 hypothetical protein [Fusobacterium sp. DD40]MBR8776638.1 hypothetical protein [Fusobacterium sp. DD17]MBR8798913.1 hypothetical protein [Fusoba